MILRYIIHILAATKIKDLTGNQNVHVYQLDLANLQSIQTFVQELSENVNAKIDCLVCNAGVWFPMDQGDQMWRFFAKFWPFLG